MTPEKQVIAVHSDRVRIVPGRTPARAALVLLGAVVLTASACGGQVDARNDGLVPEYDSKTGRLKLIHFDSNRNGRIDTWSYMDGALVVRIEIDRNEDGRVERWEHYGPGNTLIKVGISRRGDGIEDAWTFARSDGSIDRIEISSRRDGKVDRVERYDNNVLTSAEEDTDRNGRVDKWETYDHGRLTATSFDTKGRGIPDRRLVYGLPGAPAKAEEIARN